MCKSEEMCFLCAYVCKDQVWVCLTVRACVTVCVCVTVYVCV